MTAKRSDPPIPRSSDHQIPTGYQALVKLFDLLYFERNGVAPCWRDKYAFKLLRDLLATRGWTPEKVDRAMRAMFLSDDVVLSDSPVALFRKLTRYLDGARNKYGDLKRATPASEGVLRAAAEDPLRIEIDAEKLTYEEWTRVIHLKLRFKCNPEAMPQDERFEMYELIDKARPTTNDQRLTTGGTDGRNAKS